VATLIYRATLLIWLCGVAAGAQNKAPSKVAPLGVKAAKQADRQVPRSIPGKQIERLQKMTPEERERALSNLPPDRRKQVQHQLDRLDQLTPEQRQQLDERFEKLQSFPPSRQRAVRDEVTSLRKMSFSERQARLHSEEFNMQFAPEEQELIRGVFPGAAR
jgi:hypothetical protein